MKMRVGQVEARQSYFYKRCDSMNQLLKEMTLNLQNLYYGNEDGKIDKTLERMSILRSNATLAKSYLSEESLDLYIKGNSQIEKQKANGETVNPSKPIVVSIAALANELKSCNSPGVFPALGE
ncbi:hypothetical protein [Marinimicrobium agarilyticum]|uniref:hypothetical protein n=1 Tax=Marinimicrobium agarilyticum TaxID=306546 RepID=UPI00040C6B0D|nr:hypothetical protein [Marinimicrobium agarilyticum]